MIVNDAFQTLETKESRDIGQYFEAADVSPDLSIGVTFEQLELYPVEVRG